MKSRTSLLALLIGLAPTTAWADAAGEKLVRDYIAALDAGPIWASSAKAIKSDGDTVVVEDWTTSLEHGDFKLTAANLRLDGIAPGESGALAAASLSVTDLKAETPPMSIDVPLLSATHFSLPAFPAITFDAAKPFSSLLVYYKLALGLAFDRIEVPAITQTVRLGDTGFLETRATGFYNGVDLEDGHDGRIARAHLAAFSSTSSRIAADDAVAMTFEGMDASGIDLGAIATIFDTAAYRNGSGDGIWHTILSSGEIGKWTIAQAGKTVFSTGAWNLTGLKMRQTERPPAEIIDRLMTNPPDDAEAMDFVTHDLRNLAGIYGFDSFEISSLKGGEPGVAEFELGNIAVAGLDDKGLDRFAVTGLSGHGPEFAGSMKSFLLDGIEWPSWTAWMSLIKYSEAKDRGQELSPPLLADAASALLDVYPKFKKILVEGVSGGPPGQEPVSLDRYLANSTTFMGSYPIGQNGAVERLTIPGWLLRMDRDAAQVFDALGYQKLVINLAGKSDYEPQTGNAASDIKFSADDAGTMTLAVAIGGATEERVRRALIPFVTAPSGEPDPNMLLLAFADFTFDGFRLRFEDASLTKRLLSFAARMQNTDETTLIANATAFLQLGLSNLKHQAFADQVVSAVKAFLTAPKSITLQVKPSAPIKPAQLMAIDPNNPAAAIDLLGISVTAND